MKTRHLALAATAALSLAAVTTLRADVKTQNRTPVKFEGALGRIVNLFGGKGAREGIVSTVALKGDSVTINGTSAVVCGNVQTANGTVHIIDTVLMPS